MKIKKILAQATRTHGKTLPELGYEWRKVRIYRALKATVNEIRNMDYITLKKDWAIEHAMHMALTEGETFVVLTAIIDAKNVAEAYNPGEYFYLGETINGNIVFTAKDED